MTPSDTAQKPHAGDTAKRTHSIGGGPAKMSPMSPRIVSSRIEGLQMLSARSYEGSITTRLSHVYHTLGRGTDARWSPVLDSFHQALGDQTQPPAQCWPETHCHEHFSALAKIERAAPGKGRRFITRIQRSLPLPNGCQQSAARPASCWRSVCSKLGNKFNR